MNYLRDNTSQNNIYLSEIRKLKEDLNKEKLKVLESQINPHFLFNTLNSISRMALLENAPNTEEMVYCLSDLLRYTLKEKEDFPTIHNEIEYIKKYLFIQQIRFKNRLNYNINIPDKILNYRIPSMILQPILENAIIHGVENNLNGGNIEIYTEFDDKNIKIIIKDSGKGMSKSKIDAFKNNTYENLGIGITSPNQRLKSYFGDNYGIEIDSKVDVGTTVKIHFPLFLNISPKF